VFINLWTKNYFYFQNIHIELKGVPTVLAAKMALTKASLDLNCVNYVHKVRIGCYVEYVNHLLIDGILLPSNQLINPLIESVLIYPDE
jgi:hypothetical protein